MGTGKVNHTAQYALVSCKLYVLTEPHYYQVCWQMCLQMSLCLYLSAAAPTDQI